ncbi:MAG: hypothetical protein V3T77_07045, partial [Planctomycetota bacterium]
KRGWRRFQGRAPLAETLAAAVVLLSDWDCRSPLIDPFCGSGTLLVEAALLAGGFPPGLYRDRFAFEKLPQHDPAAWQQLKRSCLEKGAYPPKLILRGVDLDQSTVSGALENLDAIGLPQKCFRVEQGNALETQFRAGWNGWVVTNPPYGERVGDVSRLKELYRRFGALLREKCGGYHLALLSGNPSLAQCLGFEAAASVSLKNGAIDCQLLKLEVPRPDR